MFGKRRAAARPVSKQSPKKRSTQRRQQSTSDAVLVGCSDASKKMFKPNVTNKMAPENPARTKRKALRNISNIKKENAKSEEKRKKRLCARSDNMEGLHASKKLCKATRTLEQCIAAKQERTLTKALKDIHGQVKGLEPRLCALKKAASCSGFLQREKSKPGQYMHLVDPGSPAAKSGLQQQDQFTEHFEDIDDLQKLNYYAVPTYAKAIFDNLKERENGFPLTLYMHKQLYIDDCARTIVVNWMVEVQENFALTHETLYLAVKLLDHYLSNHVCRKEVLQLVAVTAVLIAAKYVECRIPRIDDLVYICADAYSRQSIIEMEKQILHGVGFDINIPIAYCFIRRYSECAQANLVTLTLARYICERTLQESEFLTEKASLLAASALLLAMKMVVSAGWTPALIYYTGYFEKQLLPLVKKLNNLISAKPQERVKHVHTKYSDRMFMRVTLIPPLDPASFKD